jgi:hypothetical protein
MATNKNQHFVPRCYLRPFTLDDAGLAINLFNIDRERFIKNAAVKHQCSGDYFYGNNAKLEGAIKAVEDAYASTVRGVLSGNKKMSGEDQMILRMFWLLQHLRTESASRRSMEMMNSGLAPVGADEYSLNIKEAVQIAMRAYAEGIQVADDLRVCLVANKSSIPFVTSDDPAIVTNRWYAGKPHGRDFATGLQSAGVLAFLPLSPRVLMCAYDGDVYSVRKADGWISTYRDADVEAVNQLQFLNCFANIYVRDESDEQGVREMFNRCKDRRPASRHRIRYAVVDHEEERSNRYRLIDPESISKLGPENVGPILIHSQILHGQPSHWPQFLRFRDKGFVYYNGTGVGFVRKSYVDANPGRGFRKQRS